MNGEKCTKEKEIERLTRAVFGGPGEEGVQVKVVRIETKLDNVVLTTGEIKTAVGSLTSEDVAAKATALLKEQLKLTSRQRTKIWITAIIGSASVIIALLTLITRLQS